MAQVKEILINLPIKWILVICFLVSHAYFELSTSNTGIWQWTQATLWQGIWGDWKTKLHKLAVLRLCASSCWFLNCIQILMYYLFGGWLLLSGTYNTGCIMYNITCVITMYATFIVQIRSKPGFMAPKNLIHRNTIIS